MAKSKQLITLLSLRSPSLQQAYCWCQYSSRNLSWKEMLMRERERVRLCASSWFQNYLEHGIWHNLGTIAFFNGTLTVFAGRWSNDVSKRSWGDALHQWRTGSDRSLLPVPRAAESGGWGGWAPRGSSSFCMQNQAKYVPKKWNQRKLWKMFACPVNGRGPTYLIWWPIMPVTSWSALCTALLGFFVRKSTSHLQNGLTALIGTHDQVPWLICGPWCCRSFAYDWYRYLEWTAQWGWRLERQEYYLFHPAGCNWTHHLKVVEVAVRMIQNLFVALISLGLKAGLFRNQKRWS